MEGDDEIEGCSASTFEYSLLNCPLVLSFGSDRRTVILNVILYRSYSSMKLKKKTL